MKTPSASRLKSETLESTSTHRSQDLFLIPRNFWLHLTAIKFKTERVQSGQRLRVHIGIPNSNRSVRSSLVLIDDLLLKNLQENILENGFSCLEIDITAVCEYRHDIRFGHSSNIEIEVEILSGILSRSKILGGAIIDLANALQRPLQSEFPLYHDNCSVGALKLELHSICISKTIPSFPTAKASQNSLEVFLSDSESEPLPSVSEATFQEVIKSHKILLVDTRNPPGQSIVSMISSFDSLLTVSDLSILTMLFSAIGKVTSGDSQLIPNTPEVNNLFVPASKVDGSTPLKNKRTLSDNSEKKASISSFNSNGSLPSPKKGPPIKMIIFGDDNFISATFAAFIFAKDRGLLTNDNFQFIILPIGPGSCSFAERVSSVAPTYLHTFFSPEWKDAFKPLTIDQILSKNQNNQAESEAALGSITPQTMTDTIDEVLGGKLGMIEIPVADIQIMTPTAQFIQPLFRKFEIGDAGEEKKIIGMKASFVNSEGKVKTKALKFNQLLCILKDDGIYSLWSDSISQIGLYKSLFATPPQKNKAIKTNISSKVSMTVLKSPNTINLRIDGIEIKGAVGFSISLRDKSFAIPLWGSV